MNIGQSGIIMFCYLQVQKELACRPAEQESTEDIIYEKAECESHLGNDQIAGCELPDACKIHDGNKCCRYY